MYLLLACCKVQLVAQSIPPCSRCCWTIIRGFHTIAGGTEHAVAARLDALFPILQRLVHADFAAVEIGFYAQCWSCFSELDVGWTEPFLFIFNRKTNYGNHTLELTSHCLTSDWQLKDCDTFCSMAYIFKGHLNNISGSGCLSLKTSKTRERYDTMFKN